MSRAGYKRQIADALKANGVGIDELSPFLRSLPDVALVRGRRLYTTPQILGAIAACVRQRCQAHPPGDACDLCAMGQLRSS